MLSTAGVLLVSEDNAAQSGSSDSHESHHGAKKTTTATAGSVFEQDKQKVFKSDHASASRFSLLHKKLIIITSALLTVLSTLSIT